MANNIDTTRKVKAVAIDFDGVITNLDIDWNDAIRQASSIVGHDIKSLITFYENNFGTPIFRKVSNEMEKIELDALTTAQASPFIEEFLQKLSEKKVEVYIVSMQSFDVIKKFLEQHGLTGYFKGIIAREKCPSKKVQVECISKETRTSLNQILLVDDSKRNISNCKELGVACVYFQRKQKPKETRDAWNDILSLISGPSRT
jgi:beta-phosphoglucomutase-like phosphatase (HAD superfamily)